ncbi:hypothetical protein JCM10908_003105 [Rhodotorula pacifica]|uniref:uncharacterized protein n=1 Tax=Rhodotorula pacifica TaxID=1495444 RepID=UPI003182B60A
MVYPPVPYPPIQLLLPADEAVCSTRSEGEFPEDAPSHAPRETTLTHLYRSSSPSSASTSDSGLIPTRESSLALDTRAIDLVPASVKPPQLHSTPQRPPPSAAPSTPSRPSQLFASQLSRTSSPASARPAKRASPSSDAHAKASLATEIIRLEHRVALLRKAKRIQQANNRLDHDCTPELERRAEKWREAGALAAELLADRYGITSPSAFSSPLNRLSSTSSASLPPSAQGFLMEGTATTPLRPYAPNPSTSRLSSSGFSHADRLEAFKRSLTATAHARGISEQQVLQQLEEEGGLDPLRRPEVELGGLLTPRKRRKVKREEEEDEEVERLRLPSSPPTLDVAHEGSSTVRRLPEWKPPRVDPDFIASPPQRPSNRRSRQSPPTHATSAALIADDEDSSDDELMRALDAVIAAGSERLVLRRGPVTHQQQQQQHTESSEWGRRPAAEQQQQVGGTSEPDRGRCQRSEDASSSGTATTDFADRGQKLRRSREGPQRREPEPEQKDATETPICLELKEAEGDLAAGASNAASQATGVASVGKSV